MPSSTVILGFGKLGRDLLSRLEHFLAPSESVRLLSCAPAELGARVEPVLDELLRVGRSTSGSPRLDIFVFLDVMEGSDHDLVQICSQASELVGGRYSVLFPSHLPPEQRNAALHIVAVVPALSPHTSTEIAISRLAQLETWSKVPNRYPLLSRIWLVSRHTTAGTLSDDALLTSCASFAGAFVELRDEDPVGQRLGHLAADEGKFGFLSVASLDLRESRIRKYAAVRAAYDGLRTLIERVTRPVSDASLGAQAVASLAHQNWFAPFTDGGPAEECRRLAMSFAGLSLAEVPEEISVGTFDTPLEIQSKYDGLFQPARAQAPRTIVNAGQLDQTLRSLDRAEAESTVAISETVTNLVETEVGKGTGLRRLPDVELGLRQIADSLRDQRMSDGTTAAFFKQTSSETQNSATDPEQQALTEALSEIPSSRILRPWAGMVFLGMATLGLGLALRLSIAPPSTSNPSFSSPSFAPGVPAAPTLVASKEQLGSWALGSVLGLAAATAGIFLLSSKTRKAVRDRLLKRKSSLSDSLSFSSGGILKIQADAQLQLRKRRIRRAGLAALDHSLSRLAVARATLLDAHAKYLQELRDIGIKNPAANAAGDNLTALIGSTDVLHDVLLEDLSLLSDWIARRRQIADNDLWADRLIELTWSPRGISEDIPCADHERIDELCEWQVRPLQEVSILSDARLLEAAAAKLRIFISQVAQALAPICQPRDRHGDPSTGIRLASFFAVAPQISRSAFDPVLRSADRAIPVLWTQSQAARVLLFRTWEGYHLVDIARGSGNPAPVELRADR